MQRTQWKACGLQNNILKSDCLGGFMFKFNEQNYLSDDARFIRQKVFNEEQGFNDEFDDLDLAATHLVLYNGDEPVGVCRFFGGENGIYHIGRVAVVSNYRGQDLGTLIMNEAERILTLRGAKQIELSAQCRVSGFYEKNGYKARGAEYLDEGCPHIKMIKNLKQ